MYSGFLPPSVGMSQMNNLSFKSDANKIRSCKVQEVLSTLKEVCSSISKFNPTGKLLNKCGHKKMSFISHRMKCQPGR